MKDLLNTVNPRISIAPQTVTNSNAAVVGAIIDRQGFESVTYIIQTGAMGAGTGITPSLEHGDAANLSDTSVPISPDEVVGTLALATIAAASGASKCFKIGYRGAKQFTRLTLTPSGNGAASVVLGAIAVLGHPTQLPTANPPV